MNGIKYTDTKVTSLTMLRIDLSVTDVITTGVKNSRRMRIFRLIQMSVLTENVIRGCLPLLMSINTIMGRPLPRTTAPQKILQAARVPYWIYKRGMNSRRHELAVEGLYATRS
jgi:hypothetical protein